MNKEKKTSYKYNSHALEVLEFDRILDIVASLADSGSAQETIRGLVPVTDISIVRERLEETGEVMRAIQFDDALPGISLHDMSKVYPLLKISGYNLGIEIIADMADNFETARHLYSYAEDRSEKYPRFWNIVENVATFESLENRIRNTITPSLEIADNASPALRQIRRKLERARDSLRNLVDKALASIADDVVAERLVTIRNNRFVIPVRDSMKNKVPGAVHDRSQSGRTLFIEPLASIEGNNELIELEMAEQAEIIRILTELSAEIAEHRIEIEKNQAILVRCGVIKAKARYGAAVNAVIPEIEDRPVIAIKNGRHPLLQWKLKKQDNGDNVVPLDLILGGDSRTVVVTGPNAGGKTVALKTVGLMTVMGLCGIPLPADSGTSICVPTDIFADIGDEQSVENDLSTFSSHMQQIVTVLKEAAPGALVLFDELGGGTNPADGEAIALAVLKRLTDLGALTVATTHHDGLKVFAHESEGVINASMEFDNERLMPTFRLRTGVPGSSYAFEIAARFGMPEEVLQDAISLAGSERKSLEGLIAKLEDQVRIAEDARRDAEKSRLEMEKLRSDYKQKRDDISERRRELIDDAVLESKKVLEDVNRRIELSVKNIKENNASKEAIKSAQEEVGKLKEQVVKASRRAKPKAKQDKREKAKNPEPGMTVWSDSLASAAEIVEMLDGGSKARVRIGTSKATVVVKTNSLFEHHEKTEKKKQVVRVNVSSSRVDSNEVDLRGMTFDEAKDELEMFFDRLRMTNLDTAHVIHGKGTGALRKKISVFLDKHPQVMEHRLGAWNEGSYGVTIVTLKR